MPRTFKLTIAYDGTDYAGWQIQPGQATIQGKLQRALHRITGQQIHVVGSGRTDSGVHAIAQVASLTIPDWRHEADSLARALNRDLPDTIVVTDSVEVPERFHAIRDAKSKRYRYQLQLGGLRNAFDYRYHWRLKRPVDIDAMTAAAAHFVGRRDFASFQGAGSQRRTTVREVRACELIRQPESSPQADRIAIEVEADGFLYNMVRCIVGTIVEVGWGNRSPESIDQIFKATDRDVGGQTAPAHALFLLWVDY